MRTKRDRQDGEIEIYGDSFVKLHKVLKEDDRLKAEHQAERRGEAANTNPVIIIDFATVTSIQEDYSRGGTIVIDKKNAVIVTEPLADVLDAWIDVNDRLKGIGQ